MKAFLIREDFENGDCVNCPIDRCKYDEENCPLYDVEVVNSRASYAKEFLKHMEYNDFMYNVESNLAKDLGRQMYDDNLVKITTSDNVINHDNITTTMTGIVLKPKKEEKNK